MSYGAKLTGEDLSHYSNKIKSLGLRKAYCKRHISDLSVLQNVYISLPYIMVARTTSIDKNV